MSSSLDLYKETDSENLANSVSQSRTDTPEVSLVSQNPHAIYTPLQSEKTSSYNGEFSPEIRLLLLFPASGSESGLSGSLETFRVSDAPAYIAISYEWEGPLGNLEADTELEIQSNLLSLKPNLALALTCFRRRFSEPKYLWVDAVCINQADVEERGHQVQIMSEIYQRASGVWVWLGPANDDSDLAMDVIDEVADFPEDMKGAGSRPIKWMKRVIYGPEYAKHRLALNSLFCRSYWTRVWIVQELVLGACTDIPMLCCGDRFSFLGCVIKLAKGIRAVTKIDKSLNNWKGAGKQTLVDAVKVIINLADHIDEYTEYMQITPEPDLLVLSIRYSENQCNDPRDKIYALLGISGQHRDYLQVDYSLSLEEVCRKTAIHIITRSGRLDLLSICLRQDHNRRGDSSNNNNPNLFQITDAIPAAKEEEPRQDFGIEILRKIKTKTKKKKFTVGKAAKTASVLRYPSWVPKWGQRLGPQLFPVTTAPGSVVYMPVVASQIRNGSIEIDAMICGSVMETIPIWIQGTPSSEKDHLGRLLHVLHRLQLSVAKNVDHFSSDMGMERITAALLYQILFLSESNSGRAVEHPYVDREGFIQWGASFLRGMSSGVQFPSPVGEFVEQPRRILFLYQKSQSMKWKYPHLPRRPRNTISVNTPEPADSENPSTSTPSAISHAWASWNDKGVTPDHGFGLSMANVRRLDEFAVLQSCSHVLLVRKNGSTSFDSEYNLRSGYEVIGPCYVSTLDESKLFGYGDGASEGVEDAASEVVEDGASEVVEDAASEVFKYGSWSRCLKHFNPIKILLE